MSEKWWRPTGRRAKAGAMPSWNRPRRPQREGSKKGAPGRDLAGGLRGSRSSLRIGGDQIDLEAIETALRRGVLGLAARAVAQRFNADHSDGSSPFRTCPCGGQARFAGRREKQFESVLGTLTLERAYYSCPSCQHGFFPRDSALGLSGNSMTPAVIRMVGAVGTTVSFHEGSQRLCELAGIKIDPKTVERTAEAVGERDRPGRA